jgi:hypothetical protein
VVTVWDWRVNPMMFEARNVYEFRNNYMITVWVCF